jgi:hypothetical protein
VTDLALAVAAAVERWFSHRIKRRGFVLYLIMEGSGGYPNRLQAWSQHHGRPVPDNFVWVPVRLRFVEDGTDDAAAEDVQRLKALVEQIKAETGLPCVLIVVDTAARAMTGCDENSTGDMGRFLDQCAELQGMQDRPHVCVIHHENAAGTKSARQHRALGRRGHLRPRHEGRDHRQPRLGHPVGQGRRRRPAPRVHPAHRRPGRG